MRRWWATKETFEVRWVNDRGPHGQNVAHGCLSIEPKTIGELNDRYVELVPATALADAEACLNDIEKLIADYQGFGELRARISDYRAKRGER